MQRMLESNVVLCAARFGLGGGHSWMLSSYIGALRTSLKMAKALWQKLQTTGQAPAVFGKCDIFLPQNTICSHLRDVTALPLTLFRSILGKA
ncbi:hypothetical protein C0J52_02768 [Blattella germanica]|nr:hypothetical protein C0J52_02768 [Blattella germanica]